MSLSLLDPPKHHSVTTQKKLLKIPEDSAVVVGVSPCPRVDSVTPFSTSALVLDFECGVQPQRLPRAQHIFFRR